VRRRADALTEQELADLATLLANVCVERAGEGEESLNLSLLDWLSLYRDALVRGVTNRLGIPEWEAFLYFNICPKLAIHEVAASEKVAGVAWRRFALTARGRAVLAYFDRVSPPVSAIPTPATPKPVKPRRSSRSKPS
jgi:hypothetical protein